MQLFKIAIIGLLVGGSALAGFATWRNVGAQAFEHPEGISLRQESVRSRAGFFLFYARSRYHRGGGLSGGK